MVLPKLTNQLRKNSNIEVIDKYKEKIAFLIFIPSIEGIRLLYNIYQHFKYK